jgi:putative CocE/NonD family hydrolase
LHQVTFVKNLLIPVRDGTRLAADLHRPAEAGRYPVILEYLPYRKDDLRPYTGYHHYFAQHGYVGCRVDIRGTGASEGVNTDEYVLQEQLDGYDVIEWLAQQPWCDGQVAMFGFSYGGFVCYQVAMHQPPHLKAIIPCYATDDRYTDDCHYRGGLFRYYYDFAAYGANMIAMNAMPPYPEFSGADWARIWEEHLAHNTPYMLEWIEHQTDDPYWRPGSLRGQYEKIKCPTFIIGGWRDGYPNPPLRTYAQLKDRVPTRVLIGAWNHTPPDAAVPGPTIDYLAEVVRWLAFHFKGVKNGVDDEAPIQVFLQHYDRPDADRLVSSGEWRGEAEWPPSGASELTLFLGDDGRLSAGVTDGQAADTYEYNPSVGLAGGLWSGGVPFGLPTDQRLDEALSLVYTSEPLQSELTILGWPRAILHVSSTAPIMAFGASLCDVAPDGTSALVAKGILNATRRESLTDPSPIDPGQAYELNVEIDCTAWVFAPGHRIRLDVASADYPNVWPTPLPGTNQVHRGGSHPSRLILPVVPRQSDAPTPTFAPSRAPQRVYDYRVDSPPWQVTWDVLAQRVGVCIDQRATSRLTTGAQLENESHMRAYVSVRDPADVGISGFQRKRRFTADQELDIQARMQLHSTVDAFHLAVDLEIRLDGVLHFNRRWLKSVPRRLL